MYISRDVYLSIHHLSILVYCGSGDTSVNDMFWHWHRRRVLKVNGQTAHTTVGVDDDQLYNVSLRRLNRYSRQGQLVYIILLYHIQSIEYVTMILMAMVVCWWICDGISPKDERSTFYPEEYTYFKNL